MMRLEEAKPMASLTVRQLDEKLKRLLRLRAARHGRSMEDEVRVILRQAAEETGREALDLINPPTRDPAPRRASRGRASDDEPRASCSSSAAASPPTNRSTSSAACRTAARGALRPHRGRAAFRHAACRRRAAPASAPIPICSIRRANSMSAISAWRATPTSSWSRRRPPT